MSDPSDKPGVSSLDRLYDEGVSRAASELAIRVLRDVGILARGGPILRPDKHDDIERRYGDMLDRLDRLEAIGTGAPLA